MQLPQFRIIAVVVTIIVLAITGVVAQQQNPSQLFERARMLDESNQNLSEAIKLYSQVVKQAQGQRVLAARAQLRVGLLYERMGRKAEAQRAFQAVVSQYADQADVVRQAQARMPRGVNALTSSASANALTVRQIWSRHDSEHSADWHAVSPDGRYLVFTDWGVGDLAVRDLVTGQDRRLTNNTKDSREGADNTAYSPDGKRIAYAWWWHTKDNKVVMDLRLIGVDGAGQRVLYRNPEAWNVEPYGWSPDGKSILVAIALDKRSAAQIAWVSAEDGSVRLVKTVSSLGWDISLSLSPDGRYIAYTLRAGKDSLQRDIFIIRSDGSNELPLVQSPADDYQIGWSPDGRSFLFASDRSKITGAWIIPVTDGKVQRSPELVKRDIGVLIPIGVTRMGSFYYVLPRVATSDIYTATLAYETGKLIGSPELFKTRFIGFNTWPDWSPDGRYLIYKSFPRLQGSDTSDDKLFILNFETGEEKEVLTRLKRFGPPHWFPDGRSLLVRNPGSGLFKIDAETGDTALLVPEKPGSELVLSRDGKEVFYQNKNILWKQNLETGEDRELYRPTSPTENPIFIRGIALSPDGQRLAFKVAQSLIVIPTTGGRSRELLKLREPGASADYGTVAWTSDGHYLLFIEKVGDQSEFWRIPQTVVSQSNLDSLRKESLVCVLILTGSASLSRASKQMPKYG